MARPANHQRDEAISLLRSLTAQHGAKEGARLAREQFAHVPAGTWGRWRQMAVGNAADADAQALNSLDARSRRIVEQRWLQVNDDGSGGMTLHELAAEYGVSAERIRQIEVAAMKKMKKALVEFA